jgi:glucokinase
MFLLFDIGGTKMRFATSENDDSLSNIATFNTPGTFEDSIPIFKNYFASLGIQVLTGVSGALPGTFDKEKTKLLWSKNLEGWVDVPIKAELEGIFNTTTIIANDANVAGLGEAVFGSGKGYKIVAYLTVSTGVGGTRIVDGNLDNNSLGFEPGYQIIDLDGSTDKDFLTANARYDNDAGYFQRLISGKDLSDKFGKPLEEITDPEVWDTLSKYIAVGINNVMVFWTPDVVVLGGGIAMSDYLKVEKIDAYLKKYLIAYDIPNIKKAALGDNSGLYGALAYLKHQLQG